jgi:hypothetical protein
VKDRYTHEKNLAKRISFLKFLILNSNTSETKLKREYLYELWNVMCENPVAESDKIVLYRFFGKIASDLSMVFFRKQN